MYTLTKNRYEAKISNKTGKSWELSKKFEIKRILPNFFYVVSIFCSKRGKTKGKFQNVVNVCKKHINVVDSFL